MCCRKIIFGFLTILTIGVFIAQIVLGVRYLHEPVACERSKLLTIVTLVGGSSGILSVLFVACFCSGCGL